MGKEEKETENVGDFTFEKDGDKDSYELYKNNVIELMCRHYEFYEQLTPLNMQYLEYALMGAKLSCTHGNRYVYLNAVRDHGVYDGSKPVMVCRDCILEENIYKFGACGNGKFEPLYSEEAPHPASTAINKNGDKRYECLPILLAEWGCGDINSRKTLIGECALGKMYRHEPVIDETPSRYIKHTIRQAITQSKEKNLEKTGEDVEEYIQALMTCDNLLCLYGGVITIAENAELEREEESKELEELNVRECSEELKKFLKSYETGGIRTNKKDKLKSLQEGEPALKMYYDSRNNPTIGWGHLIEGNEEYIFSSGLTKYLLKDQITMDEAEEIFQNDVDAKQTDLNLLLDKYNLTATQQEYDMLLSLIFNTGSGILINSKNKQTKRWFETGGYKNIEYSKYVLGDITSGGDAGVMNRKADELEILMGVDYLKRTDNYERILSDTGERIWNNPSKINELAIVWENSLDDVQGEPDNENP